MDPADTPASSPVTPPVPDASPATSGPLPEPAAPAPQTTTGALEASDAAAAAVAVAPRVSLDDINAAIADTKYIRGDAFFADFLATGPDPASEGMKSVNAAKLMTLCLITMKNGFTVIGKSAPASADNFNEELGRKFAREDAIRQIWPLMGFALRDRLSKGA